jgi:hypothetical protein
MSYPHAPSGNAAALETAFANNRSIRVCLQ